MVKARRQISARGQISASFFVFFLTLCWRTPCPNSLAKSLKSLASCFKMSFSLALSSRPTVSCPVIFAQLLTQRSISWSDHTKKNTLYTPVKTKLQHLPSGKPRAFDAFSCPGGWKFDHHLQGVGNLITSLDIMLRVALIPRGFINHCGDKL